MIKLSSNSIKVLPHDRTVLCAQLQFHPRKPGPHKGSPHLHFFFEPVIPLANANSQLISIVDLNQLTGPPQCKLFEQKQLSLSLNSHRSVPNSNLPAYLHPGWASPKCKVTSLVLTKLLPPLNCTPPLTITDPIAAFTGLL